MARKVELQGKSGLWHMKKRESEVAILAQVPHLCLGVCDTPLHQGGG